MQEETGILRKKKENIEQIQCSIGQKLLTYTKYKP